MKRRSFLSFVAIALIPGAVRARASHALSFTGRLVAIHFERAAISVRVGRHIVFVSVTPNTAIERRGAYATLASLQIGDRVEVLAARSGKILVAQSIRAE